MRPQNRFNELRDKLEGVANQVFADDLRLNKFDYIYIALASECGLDCSGAKFVGSSSGTLHHELRQDLATRWRGAGPAILLDDEFLASQNDGYKTPDANFIGCVIHELGHVANREGLCQREPTPGFTRDSLEHFTKTPDKPDKKQASMRPGHMYDWIRATLHVLHRFEYHGIEAQIPLVIDRDHYGYDNICDYQRALGDELERLRPLPLGIVKKLNAPTEFLELFLDNMKRVPTWTYDDASRSY